jgi:hypothetical protein
MTPREWISYVLSMALVGIPAALVAYFAGLLPLVACIAGVAAAIGVYRVREQRAKTKAAP